ncbi:MAG: HD domain-containing protein [Candidatus Zixiibacteriota bacterium]|nr:MAG: HD domain-containing protein [candidate division Zixibacteria bacterium]
MNAELISQYLLDSAAVEIVVLDAQENIADLNQQCLTATGLEKSAVVGRPAELWDEISRLKLREDLARNRVFQGEIREIGPDGQWRAVHYTFSPIVDSAGRREGYVGIGRPMMDRDRFEKLLLERMEQIRQTQGVAMVGLAKLAEYRDPETGHHLERMRRFSRLLAEELATQPEYAPYITEEYIEGIYNSSPLHDIGKVGIPDAILLKPGRLTPEEFEIMKQHSRIGGDALRAADQQLAGESFLTMGKEIAYHHHEKWDGTGYPDGLRGTAIPLSARLVAVADVYDALTSKRVYKEAINHDRARAIIIESAGKHFAEDCVRAFLKREADFLVVREMFRD